MKDTMGELSATRLELAGERFSTQQRLELLISNPSP